ncbi:hypothetical protein CVT25_009258 [Psilocybe cyanescens]|uniref:Translocon Sec61/SecY plug domain-containing protein n=1 Tax=Psilocybe cyanescens TaxID=93625 RepID=A0A409XTQ1_PSICY|nr:hypothetical protein CVT25_009258 [Psilocybe cyanescens]
MSLRYCLILSSRLFTTSSYLGMRSNQCLFTTSRVNGQPPCRPFPTISANLVFILPNPKPERQTQLPAYVSPPSAHAYIISHTYHTTPRRTAHAVPPPAHPAPSTSPGHRRGNVVRYPGSTPPLDAVRDHAVEVREHFKVRGRDAPAARREWALDEDDDDEGCEGEEKQGLTATGIGMRYGSGLSVRFLNLIWPFLCILPEVSSPDRKLLCTAVALLIFLVCSQVPLYRIMSSYSSDPLYWMRVIIASNRGTPMELGITHIITSRMIIQLLEGVNLIYVDFSLKEDRALSSGAQKLFTLIIALGQAPVYVFTELYGQPSDLGAGVCLLLVIQLIFAALIVILLDEFLQKGYGLGIGRQPVHRDEHLPVDHVEGFLAYHCEHLQSALTSITFIMLQMLTPRFLRNLLVKILGVWEASFKFFFSSDVGILADPLEDSPQLRATGRIAYCMFPPHILKEAVLDPIHTAIYITFMLSACALFSKTWIEISGSRPQGVAKQLKNQQMVMAVLKQVIPTAISFDGAILSLLSAAADLSVWEIGMRKLCGPEMAAFGDLL